MVQIGGRAALGWEAPCISNYFRRVPDDQTSFRLKNKPHEVRYEICISQVNPV